MAAFGTLTYAALVSWCVGLASLSHSLEQPPSWPTTFSVNFHEDHWIWKIHLSGNAGAWHYDFSNKIARFDHLQGQIDNFCHGRGLRLKEWRGDCHLLFNTTDMFVHYPRERQCCRACGVAEGCTVLKPTWMAGAKYLGTENINGTACQGWETDGAAATDRWYQATDGTPCQYSETIKFWPHSSHNITFDMSSFSLDPIPTSVFDIPGYCDRKCPYPWRPI
ncbi:Hypp3338 [Branchiostoma lanceolatum]|uniref:Hypp3338 protein n=1 Tax=Branchiostoma lanceolatum TaxID=7740 RepID=A0A8J9ZZA7_BRALA|nr:Hypp3338 [Branchiostoma lanceolatum]